MSRMLAKFRNNRRGAGGVVVTLIATMIMLLVGILVVNALIASQTPDDTWSEDANTTWDNVQTYIWIALGLVCIGLVVIGAAAILSYLNFGGGRT